MCAPKAPKIPDPIPPAPPPPPPTKTAQKMENKSLKKRQGSSRTRGSGSLTVRRSTVNTGSSGTGANISY